MCGGDLRRRLCAKAGRSCCEAASGTIDGRDSLTVVSVNSGCECHSASSGFRAEPEFTCPSKESTRWLAAASHSGGRATGYSHSGTAQMARIPCSRHGSAGQIRAQTDLVSVYKSSPALPHSRPQPDCLYPPKGRAESNTLKQLIQTVPAFS